MDPQSQKLVSNKELKKYKEQPNRDEEYNNWKKNTLEGLKRRVNEVETKKKEKVNKTQIWFFGKRNKNWSIFSQTHQVKKKFKRGLKSIKSGMKKKLQPTQQKYKAT